MGMISFVKEIYKKMFLKKEADDVFGIELHSSGMEDMIQKWYDITGGKPPWADEEDDIRTINFAQYIDDVTSGLVALDIGINMPDSPRGRYLQKIADYALQEIDSHISDALGNAGIMFKANGENVDFFYPGWFLPTDWDSNKNIAGCMFVRRKYIKKTTYTKFEYHRYEDINGEKVYVISNRAFKNGSSTGKGQACALDEVPEWAGLSEDVYGYNIDIPLFSYYGNPKPNFIDRDSPLKIPIWANCMEELRNIDTGWSRKSAEIEDSKHITFLPEQVVMFAERHNIKLPRFIKRLQSGSVTEPAQIQEHTATILTEQRISDINSCLAMISAKIGFDQGFFVLDEKTGVVTATQIEADKQSTIRTIKNLRDPLKEALTKLLYGASKMADYYTDIPAEAWTNHYSDFREEVSSAFKFGDITYSYEEDKASWWKYRIQGDVPAWLYYVKFEGMSEDDAKAMTEEARP